MKILYLDCFAGISGDMFLGALVDIGLDPNYLKNEIKKLDLNGYSIKIEKEKRKGITGTRFNVEVREKQQERNLKGILNLIKRSKLSDKVKGKAVEIFNILGKAEAKVHGVDFNSVHFHEVGAADSIIDILGAVIGVEKLGFDKIYSSRPLLGKGMLGNMPLPAPAVTELLRGIPVKFVNRDAETVTPTGAAFVKAFAKKIVNVPEMKIEKIGYGIGARNDKDIPNVLRVISGELVSPEDTVCVIETNIDDMNPQIYGTLMDKLFNKGALDVFWTPVQMKKNRPGILATIICRQEDIDDLIEILFRETTTFGVRYYETNRRILDREIKKVKGKRIKIGKYKGKLCTISPEYEDWVDTDLKKR